MTLSFLDFVVIDMDLGSPSPIIVAFARTLILEEPPSREGVMEEEVDHLNLDEKSE